MKPDYPPGVTGNEKQITGHPEIEWEDTDDVLEDDIDGHGTRVIALSGRQPSRGGYYEYEATAQSVYPYDDYEIDNDSIECVGFVEREAG